MELRQFRVVNRVIAGLVVLLISACGGGGGGSGDPGFIGGGIDDPGNGGGAGAAALTLALTDSAGNPTTVVTSSQPATLTATYTATDGSPIAQEILTVATTLSSVLPAGGTQITNENGVATFQILAASNSGADTATVTVDAISQSVSFNIDAQLTLSLTDSSNNPITFISQGNPGIVTVTSSDSAGVPIEGELVTVTATAGSIAPTTRLTNASGVASFVLEAGTGSGAGTVAASVGNRQASTNFEIVAPTQETNILTLSLTDSGGTPVTNITSISPGVLNVLATDSFGQPLAGQIINAVSTIGAVTPESGSALTDLNGLATFGITAGTTLGAGTVSATLGDVSASVNFQVGEANLRVGRFDGMMFIEGEIDAGSTSLPAAGSTPLSVSVVDGDGNLVTTAVPVQFSSGCASLDPPAAEISAQVNTINGVATSTYTALSGCVGTDNVTAAIVQGNISPANVSLTIASADVNSIAFISATPESIALRGTGGVGREEASSVAFQVLDNTGSPAANVEVTFSLSTTIGGLSLTNTTATTNEQGIATAIVLAGDVSTSVRVRATIIAGSGAELSTVSDSLVVSTGLPDQNSVSLSSSLLNPGGGNVDGVEATITIRLADKFNNPVPDGTVAFFTTEFGAIDDSCLLASGSCTVTWRSQSPRLPLTANSTTGANPFVSTISNRTCPTPTTTGIPCAEDLGPIYGRRSQITVIAVGEEAFVDINGNGVFDVGEPFEDLPEAFLDKNENGIFDNTTPLCTADATTLAGRECAEGLEEIFFDFNEDGVYNAGNGLYNGSLCPQATADAGQCSRELVHVRDELTLVMSGVQQIAVLENGTTPITGSIDLTTGDRNFTVVVADEFNNLPSAGATVEVIADACTVLGGNGTVPNSNSIGAYTTTFVAVETPDNAAVLRGSIEVSIAGSVGSTETTLVFQCTDDIN
ncbi:MAG: hypothetical protein AAGI24_00255 [Pseudomonadota bacterium]